MEVNKTEFGDCREIMRRWAEQGVRVNTCVTSPPYLGLRDYGYDGQIGLEETPDAYVANLVEVFRCVWDVLADDGTVWIVIGDSYGGYHGNKNAAYDDAPSNKGGYFENQRKTLVNHNGIKNKDLIGIPWRVAFALQADGWYLRQDIIWHKPNPMPESVTDRCTKAHEYIFLLSKSPKYYYDHEAVKEKATGELPYGGSCKPKRLDERGAGKHGKTGIVRSMTREEKMKYYGGTRNRRSVWTVTTKPYKAAHFAVFPQQLIEPCILAGCPEDGIVLDPFMGSGTTAVVALNNRRNYLGCEMNPEYEHLQQERLRHEAAQTSFI